MKDPRVVIASRQNAAAAAGSPSNGNSSVLMGICLGSRAIAASNSSSRSSPVMVAARGEALPGPVALNGHGRQGLLSPLRSGGELGDLLGV